MEDIIYKILEYCNSVEDDWDGYGAYAPTILVKKNLSSLLNSLPLDIISAIDLFDGVVICTNGTVGIEWVKEKNKIWIEIGEDSMTIMTRFQIEGDAIYDGENHCPIQYNGSLEKAFNLFNNEN